MYRKAVLSDSNAICGLVCGQEGLELSREKFYDILNEQLQDRQHYYCLVYEENSRIEGVLNLRIERQLRYAGSVAEITEFFVAPDHRNQGIGTGLFEQALELAQRFRCRHLEVSCRAEEESGRRFFEKRGLMASYMKLDKQL